MTLKGTFLSEVFLNKEKSVTVQTKQFIKRLNYVLSQCFRKIRVKQTKENKKMEDLLNKRRILRPKTDGKSIALLEETEEQMSQMCSEDNYKAIQEVCQGLTCEDGGMNVGKLWRIKKKLTGIYHETPTAMMDAFGNLVTSTKALEQFTVQMYTERLKTLPIKEELKMNKLQRENLFNERLEEARRNITPNWDMEDLNTVIKQLKKLKVTRSVRIS